MEMCYDGALVMPSSYAVMSEEEMTYTEGGRYWSARGTLGEIRDTCEKIFKMCVGGTIASGVVTVYLPLLGISTAYNTALAWKAANCVSKCEKWINSKKYTKKTKGKLEQTIIWNLVVDMDVKIV